MFTTPKRILPLLCAVIILAGCGKDSQQPLRLALNPWPGYQLILLAEGKGYFEEFGVDVEIVEMLSSGEVNRAFERGYVDLAGSTLTDLANIELRSDRDPVVFSITDYSNGADVILAREGFADLPSLKGKRIGADVTALDYMHLTAALDYYDMDSGDVEIIAMRQTDLIDAFARGEIDAGVTYPPVSDELLERYEDLHTIFDTSLIPGTIIDVILADRVVLLEREDELVLFMKAICKAHRFYVENREQALEEMGALAGMSGAEFAEQLEGLELISVEEQYELLSDHEHLDAKLEKVYEMYGHADVFPHDHEHYIADVISRVLN